MCAGTLDDQYIRWLYSQVADVEEDRPSRTYWRLIKQLYSTEFAWSVPNDENRAEEGLEIRREWVHTFDVDVDREWMRLGCSFLEMMIALSRRMEFEAEREPSYWFWVLIENLGLLECNDLHDCPDEYVENILHVVIYRRYDRNGQGGLFPLRNSNKDQRKVELWYQLCEYLLQDQ